MPTTTDPPAAALAWLKDYDQPMTYAALSEHTRIPTSTLWYRKHGRKSRRDAAAKRQYLTPTEEDGLVDSLRDSRRRGIDTPTKLLPYLAFAIVRRRSCTFQTLSSDTTLKPPGKNWSKAFLARHPELKGRRNKPLESLRYDIYDKAVEWFEVIGKLLQDPIILPENVYNFDETGTRISVSRSRKYIVHKDDKGDVKGPKANRVQITAVECISADGRSLDPLVIWPASTLRSDWTIHETPGWHFTCTESGYSNRRTVLDWYRHVFDPQTKDRANGRPRVLISDGYGSHEAPEVIQFCHENNIISVRFPSHSTHKLQPCDIGVFGPIKTYYGEELDEICRGGVITIGKQHFTEMYSKSRIKALNPRTIKNAWARAGLYPWNPDRVLRTIPNLSTQDPNSNPPVEPLPREEAPPLRTPVTFDEAISIRRFIEQNLDSLDPDTRSYIDKLANSTERVITARDYLFEENSELLKQNNANNARVSRRSMVVGKAKIMSYEEVQQEVERREKAEATKGSRRGRKGKKLASAPVERQKSREEEIEAAHDEFEREEWGIYGSVF